MNVYDKAHELARLIQESSEYTEFARLREVANEDATNSALLKEYKRLQAQLQLAAMNHQQLAQEEMQRFQQLATLLYMNSDVQSFLMAEMRLQKIMADIFKIISEAGGMDFDFLNG